jgi:hypothetical protein
MVRAPGTIRVKAAFAVVAAATATAVAGLGPTATAPTPVVHVATTGIDTNPGTATAPVATFGHAYQIARPGATVEVAAGDYGYQSLARDAAKRSTDKVVFTPAAGAAVNVGILDFGQGQLGVPGPEHVTVRGMAIAYLRAWEGSRDLLWQNIKGKHFDVFDATDVVISGGDYGPCQAPRDDGACVSRIAGTAERITLDGVAIHDVTSTDLANYHVDGMFIRGGKDIVIRNSRFWGNMITNIRVQDQPCCKNTNLLIENNWFNPPLQGDGVSPRFDAIDIDNDMDGLVIRNNSFSESGLQLLGTYTRARIVGNLMNSSGCAPGVSYSHNVFVPFSAEAGQRACGATDRKVPRLGYENPASFDLRVRRNSPAFAAGDPQDCPAKDIRGKPRLRGLKCDAGAYERQEAWICKAKKIGKRTRRNSVLVALWAVKPRLRAGDTIGRCGSH